jgi:hypothetical protein
MKTLREMNEETTFQPQKIKQIEKRLWLDSTNTLAKHFTLLLIQLEFPKIILFRAFPTRHWTFPLFVCVGDDKPHFLSYAHPRRKCLKNKRSRESKKCLLQVFFFRHTNRIPRNRLTSDLTNEMNLRQRTTGQHPCLLPCHFHGAIKWSFGKISGDNQDGFTECSGYKSAPNGSPGLHEKTMRVDEWTNDVCSK